MQSQDFSAAKEHLLTALAVARQTQWSEALVTCQLHLASLYLDQKQPDLTEPFLVEARHLAQEKQITYQMTTVHYLTAQLLLGQGVLMEAETEARTALSTAQTLGMRNEEGQAWRVLGLTLLMQNTVDKGVSAFEQSLDCFYDNIYEKNSTQRQLDRALAKLNGQA